MSDFEDTIKNLLNTPPKTKKESSVDETELIKLKILYFLNEGRKTGKVRGCNLFVLADTLNIDRNEFFNLYVQDLESLGLIKSTFIPDGAKITPNGIAVIDKNDPFVNQAKTDIKHISIGGDVIQSNVTLGNGNSPQVNITFGFIAKLEKAINESPELSPGEKKSFIKNIKESLSSPKLWLILGSVLAGYTSPSQ